VNQRLRELLQFAMSPNPLVRPPGLDGNPGLAIPGMNAIPRPAAGDAVVTAEAPGIPGDEVGFVTLEDGTLIAAAAIPDGVLFPLATEIEKIIDPPYEAEARRIVDDNWGVAATEVEIVDVDAGSPGETLTFSSVGGVESTTIDGENTFLPRQFRGLLTAGDDVVLDARRADETTWVVQRSLL